MEDGGHMTERIISLALEIICLLTGQSFPPVKSGDHVTIAVAPPPSPPRCNRDKKKILEVTNKIIKLLTGEGAGGRAELRIWIKEEVKEENHDNVMEKLDVLENSAKQDQESSQACQEEKLSTCEDRKMAEEAAVRGHTQYKEDAASVIGTDGQYVGEEENMVVFPDSELEEEEEDLAADSPGGDSGDLHIEELSSEESPEEEGFFHHISRGEQEMFPCSECGKCFIRKGELLSHQKSHTVEKLYSCAECGKCFSYSSHLTAHKRIHTGERPYSCPQCGKSFPQKSALIRHERVHTGEKPYTCGQCGKSFSYKTSLITHRRFHTGEKPFSCAECGKSFSQNSALTVHRRVHTGEKRFSCPDCGKCFAYKVDMMKHGRIHHGNKP